MTKIHKVGTEHTQKIKNKRTKRGRTSLKKAETHPASAAVLCKCSSNARAKAVLKFSMVARWVNASWASGWRSLSRALKPLRKAPTRRPRWKKESR